ncbi:MAG TPA: hypothetical protein PKY81_17240 [bacterium]|nr:hypothetical protein [bacterium]
MTVELIKYLNSFCPVLLTLGNIQNKANLNFLEKYSNPSTYSKLTLLKLKRIDGIGEKKAQEILNIVKNAKFDTDLADTTSTINYLL